MIAARRGVHPEDRPQPTTSDAPVRIGQPPPVAGRAATPPTRARSATRSLAAQPARDDPHERRRARHGVRARPRPRRAGAAVDRARRRALQHDRAHAARAACRSSCASTCSRTTSPTIRTATTSSPISRAPIRSSSREVVLIGAHLDSWHTGTGASDNADGAAVDARSDADPEDARRCSRSGRSAWRSGAARKRGCSARRPTSTQHLAGDANKAARDKLFVYFNIDPATGPIYGWYMQDSEPAKALFDAWLEPLKDLGVRQQRHRRHRQHRSSQLPRRRRSRLQSDPGVQGLRRPHAPHQRRPLRARARAGPEAERDRDGVVRVAGGEHGSADPRPSRASGR